MPNITKLVAKFTANAAVKVARKNSTRKAVKGKANWRRTQREWKRTAVKGLAKDKNNAMVSRLRRNLAGNAKTVPKRKRKKFVVEGKADFKKEAKGVSRGHRTLFDPKKRKRLKLDREIILKHYNK